MKLLRYILILLSLQIYLLAGKISQNTLAASYVYKLSKNIEWNNYKDTFSIHLVSSNRDLNNEFKKLAKNIKLDGKKIIISTSRDENIAEDVDVVYLTSPKNHLYKKIFSQTKNQPILLISNDYENKKIVMINLFKKEDKTTSFEINRANILAKGLEIKPDIILLGGTELDVAYLYRDTRDSLSSKELEVRRIHNELKKSKKNLKKNKKNLLVMKNEVLVFKKKNSELQSKIKNKEIILKKTKKEIKKYNSDIKELKYTMQTKNNKINTQDKKLEILSKKFEKTKQHLEKIQSSLTGKIQKLKKQEDLLNIQVAKVLKKEKELQKIEKQILKKTQEFEFLEYKITKQNALLQTQEKTIDKQKDFLQIALISLGIFLFLVLLISYFLRKQSKTNTLLEATQEELRIAIDRADNASLNKSKFLASMSHELRTPLNAVLGYSQLLQRDTSFSDKHLKTFKTIRDSGEHLLGVINDILLISKIEAGHIEVTNHNANIHELIDTIYTMFFLKTNQKAISLETIVSDNLPNNLFIDIDKIRQILINILNNAVKFTDKGGIKIYVDFLDNKLLISVEDTGVGVAEDEIDKLFKQYEQTTSGISEGNGTGLGLALVKEFVYLLKGEISVSSSLNVGSTFKISIPCVNSGEAVQEKKLKQVVKIAPNQKEFTVLIVDDVETNRDLLGELLEIVGFKTFELVNGLEAVEWVKSKTPDIILMDLRMPVMGGKEATLKIIDINKNIPIVAITASIFEMEKLMESPYPFVSAIPKPFDQTQLLHLISNYIDVIYEYDNDAVVKKFQEISLENLPLECKDELLLAANSMNITAINRVLSQLDDSYAKETKYMKDLVSDLNFEKLKQILT